MTLSIICLTTEAAGGTMYQDLDSEYKERSFSIDSLRTVIS